MEQPTLENFRLIRNNVTVKAVNNVSLAIRKGETLEEPVFFHQKGISRPEVEDKVKRVMEQVGVDPK